MLVTSTQCGLSLSVAGRTATLKDHLTVVEDVSRPTELRACLACDGSPAPEPGDKVELVIDGCESGISRTLTLWCRAVACHRHLNGEHLEISAADPMAFLGWGRVLATYAGNRSLREVIGEVLSEGLSGSPAAVSMVGENPTVAPEWLLCCHESGAGFVLRLAFDCGAVVYYDGNALRCSWVGRIESGAAATELRFGANLESLVETEAPGSPGISIAWHDPSTLDHRNRSQSRPSGTILGDPWRLRLASANATPPQVMLAAGSQRSLGKRLIAETYQLDLRPGSVVRTSDGHEYIAERVEHQMSSGGTYRNRVEAVEERYWGTSSPRPQSQTPGPFLAEVVDNHDPLRCGRLRIALCDDAQRQPSPWLPYLVPSAGEGRGWYWMPEVGDRVWVLTDVAAPERALILGAARGAAEPVPAEWDHSANARKGAKWGEDLELCIDEEEGTAQMTVGGSHIKLGSDGFAEVAAGDIRLKADRTVEAQAVDTVSVDGARILLG